MLTVISAMFVLVLKLAIYYVIGYQLTAFFLKRENSSACLKLISGFLGYQVLFQICAIGFIVLKQTLTRLSIVWGVCLVVLLLVLIIKNRIPMKEDIGNVMAVVAANKGIVLVVGMVVAAVCYYVSINGAMDEDARYYIGFINTTLTSDSMYRYNAYTGLELNSLYLRRALVTFDIHSAVVCKAFSLHPLVETRLVRGPLNVILTAMAIYLFGTELFRRKEKVRKAAGVFTCVSFFLYFVFDNTIYTNATFLLQRAYEGKSFSANVLMIFMTYAFVAMVHEKKDYYKFLFLGFWAGVAISSSALAVNIFFIMLIVVSYIANKLVVKKVEKQYEKC